MVHVARRLVAGEILFVDVASFTGPLPFELLAGLFRVFGDSLWVPRGAVVALQAAICAAAWGIGVRAGGRGVGHGAAACVAVSPVLLFPMLSIYFYSTLATGLAWLAAYAALRGTRSLRWAAAAGAGVAAVALCKQNLGVALAASLLVAASVCAPRGSRLRTALAFTGGGAAVATATLGHALWVGSLAEMLHSLVVIPLSLGETFRASYPDLWPLGDLGSEVLPQRPLYLPYVYAATVDLFLREPPTWIVVLTQGCFALPPAALLATLGLSARRRLSAASWIQFALLAALATNLFPRPDWGHLTVVLPAAAVQMVLLWSHLTPATAPRWRAAGATAFAGCLALGTVVVEARLYSLAAFPEMGPRVPLFLVSNLTRSPALSRVVRYLRRNTMPAEPIFVARGEPLLYYATGTRNPTPYGGVIPGLREEQERAILEGLEKVRYVVMSDVDQPLYNYYRDELPAVQAYLERHFEVAAPFREKESDWLVVLKRGPDRGPTLIDLVDTPCRRWVRDATGRIRDATDPVPRLAVRQNRRFLAFWVGERGGGVDFDFEIPPGAVFQTGVGYAFAVGNELFIAPPRARMVAAVDDGSGFRTLENVRVLHVPYDQAVRSDGRGGVGKRWISLEVDLSRYVGRSVTLRLAMVPESPTEPEQLGWFGSPRIARPPEAR